MKNSSYLIKKHGIGEELCKSFLVFLNNFDLPVKEISEMILSGKLAKIAVVFSPSRTDSFEVVSVVDDCFNMVGVRSNLSDLKASAKKGEKIVFKGFCLRLNSLVSVTPKDDHKGVVRGIPAHFPVVLGEGVLFVEYGALSVGKKGINVKAA